MRINFRQGLISFQKDNGIPAFLNQSATPDFVSHIVSPTPTVVAFAHGDTDYLMHFDKTVDDAWGPMVPGESNYLFWDIDVLTANVTRGITTLAPIHALDAPTALEGQHWFDLSTNTMKVWSTARNKWVAKIRVFAGVVPNGNASTITHFNAGTQVGLNVAGNPGFIMRDTMLQPLRKSNGEFLTDDSPVHVLTTAGTSGVLVQPVNRIVPVRAGETIPAMSLVYFSADDTVRLASSNPALMPARVPVGIVLESITAGEVGHLSPFGEITYDQWDWGGHAGEPLYVDFNGALTLTRPAGLLAYRVGFIKNKNTVLLGVDAETFPQVYQSDVNTLQITGAPPVSISDHVNGLGERIVNISVPDAGSTSGLMTPAHVAQLGSVDTRIGVAESSIISMQASKADVNHQHLIVDVTGLQAALDGKSDVGHAHSEYAVINHTHPEYAAVSHVHTIPDVDGLQDNLNMKANRVHLNSFDEVYVSVNHSGANDVGSGNTLTQALLLKSDVGHNHPVSEVSGLQIALDSKSNTGHGHVITDVEGLENELANRAYVSHTHTISHITDLGVTLSSKANITHSHAIADVINLEDELATLNSDVAGKAPILHLHTIVDVVDLAETLATKANASHTHEVGDVNGLVEQLEALSSSISSMTEAKADAVHTHQIADVDGLQIDLDNINSSLTAAQNDILSINSALGGKADAIHSHSISEVEFLQDSLDAKADVIHTHVISDVADLQTTLVDLQGSIPTIAGAGNGEVQFNLGGSLDSDSTFTFDKITGTLSSTKFSGDGSELTGLWPANKMNIINVEAIGYTISASDMATPTMLRVTTASANTITIPDDTVSIPIGHSIIISQSGDGTVTIAALGVTINAIGTMISAKHGKATAVKIGANEWDVYGDLMIQP